MLAAWSIRKHFEPVKRKRRFRPTAMIYDKARTARPANETSTTPDYILHKTGFNDISPEKCSAILGKF
jgi:hypothetical protein